MNMKLEVVLVPVADVDRAKAFYEKLGWRLDIDLAAGGFRGVQVTPSNSEASIIFGKGVTSGKSSATLVLAVDDVDAARERGLSLRRRPLQQHGGESARRRARSGRAFLLLVRLVRGPGRQLLAASGDQGAASRPRMEANAGMSRGHREPCGAPARERGTPRRLREDPRRASLIELVRVLPERSSERQQPEGGSGSGRPLHG